ncbi:hypothetical protein FOPG_17551 [Fusarium oxysporum f. sp. conglutinans race 2 54008]|uniref:Uncharacterized protein n=1 Tax=Fusarium oxysporum f. sp. conglutinans race 2 54008 TaxID=1089457 RepID=X0GRL9_FUSOX|nr:hypothetical protein FOPG_17551 [Fusarium oxysporum f. sp. conglutinans race 2 54008]
MATSNLQSDHSNPSHPLLPVFYRRKRYDATVHYINNERYGLFKDVPIDELVSLAFFSTPTDLKTFGPGTPELPSLVLQKYRSDKKNDPFHDWQLFCKTVNDHGRRSGYLLEGAISFGTEQIPQSWQHLWQLRGRELLQLLRRGQIIKTTCVDDQPAHRPPLNHEVNEHLVAESPTAFTSFLDTDSRFTAEMPDVSRLTTAIGNFLYVGMSMSFKRVQEENKQLTGAVRLHAAATGGGDFKLEIFINTPTARAITHAIRHGDEELLRIMLGGYLAEGMDGSLWKQEEKRLGITSPTTALGLVPTEGEDYRLFIMLRFSTGQQLFSSLFPI